MSTIRSHISEKSVYRIDPERYLELKHFCRQYKTWVSTFTPLHGAPIEKVPKSNDISDPTGSIATDLATNESKRKLLEDTALATEPVLAKYILLAVTEGYTYTYLKTACAIPCCRNTFYGYYRKFFWLLDKARG